jgi:hypothetical protein
MYKRYPSGMVEPRGSQRGDQQLSNERTLLERVTSCSFAHLHNSSIHHCEKEAWCWARAWAFRDQHVALGISIFTATRLQGQNKMLAVETS